MAKVIKITDDGLKKLEEELEYLKTEGRADIAEKIKIARGYGDLSENSEYDEAKNEQAKIEVEKPFEYAAEVESLQAELSAIDAELDLNKEETPIVLDNEAEPEKAEIEVLDETEEEVEVA